MMKTRTSIFLKHLADGLRPTVILISVILLFSGFKFSDLKKIYYCSFPYQLSGHSSGKVIDGRDVEFQEIPGRQDGKAYLEFFALGCAGSGNRGQKLVAEQMAEISEKEKIAFVLYLGDNFYGCGVNSVRDNQWKTQFERIYDQESLQIPFYSILGNHDYIDNPQAQVEYSKQNDRWTMPDRFYSFEEHLSDGTVIGFFAIDTEAIIEDFDREGQIGWLRKELQKSTADWKIVLGHRPLYSGDPNKLRGEEAKKIDKLKSILEPVFVSEKIDLYLTADSHTLEVLGPVQGVHYLISGAASRPRSVVWRDQTRFAASELGFAWFLISKESMGIRLINAKGETLYEYQIRK